jgi:hypothetical protein
MKTKTMYMHTLDGKPAAFNSTENYVYFCSGREPVVLVESLKQIRRAQKLDRDKWPNAAPFKYGYVLVKVPVSP